MLRYVSILVLIVIGMGVAHGQGSVISKAEWDKYQDDAKKFTKLDPYRVKGTLERRPTNDAEWSKYSYRIEENISPNRWHLLQSTGAGATSEFMRIGRTYYEKKPDGSWQIWDPKNEITPSPVPGYVEIEGPVMEYRKLGSEIIFGQKTTVLQLTVRSKRSFNGNIVDFTLTIKTWFDEQGRKLKTQNTGFDFVANCFHRRTDVYEYDPNIKIEIPIK